MNFESFKTYEPLYIIGHKNPDVDSCISTILLAKIFKSKGIDCYPCLLDHDYEVDIYNKNILDDCCSLEMRTIANSDEYNYVLVDHNDPSQSIGFGKRIVWGIDHHKNANILSNVVISERCSCSLFIYEYFKDVYPFDNEEKFMIYMASLADSLFYKGSRFTLEDKALIDELGYDLDANELFKKYFIPTDLSDGLNRIFNNTDIENNNIKVYNYRGIKFESAVVKTYNQYESLKNDFIKEVEKRDNFLGIWIDFDKEMSFAYFNYNGIVKEFIYDCIASRAATVIPDIYKYIDDNLHN